MRRSVTVVALSAALVAASAAISLAAQPILDDTFSGDGRTSLNVLGDDFSLGMVADGTSSYVVGGTRNTPKAACQFLVARYNDAGRLDDTFHGDGVRTFRPDKQACATSVAVLSDGRVAVAGWSSDRHVSATVVMFNANGSLDTGFSGDGVQRITERGVGVGNPQVLVDDADSLWLAWYTLEGRGGNSGDYRIARIKPTGGLDTTFASQGLRKLDIAKRDVIKDAAVGASGRLSFLGWAKDGTSKGGKSVVVRVAPGGSAVSKTLNLWRNAGTYPVSIDVDASERAVVGVTPTYNTGWGAVRLTDQMRYDSTFSGNGVAAHGCKCYSSTGVLTPDGLVLLGGNFGKDNRTVGALFRSNGSYDREFANSSVFNLFSRSEFADDAVVDSNGKVLFAGNEGGASLNAYIARMNILN